MVVIAINNNSYYCHYQQLSLGPRPGGHGAVRPHRRLPTAGRLRPRPALIVSREATITISRIAVITIAAITINRIATITFNRIAIITINVIAIEASP